MIDKIASIRLALRVIELLCGRKGFDDWWENLDKIIRSEIISAIAKELQK